MHSDPNFVKAIAQAWTRSDASRSDYERGIILEELVRFVFGSLPGLTHWKTRHLTSQGDAEFDVCFHNDIRLSPFPFAEPALVVECKNTGTAIGSADLRNFTYKLHSVQVTWAFLVAANGVTGSGKRNTHAHAVIRDARKDGINVLVVTRRELELLRSADDFASVVRDKIMLHTLSSPQF